MYGQYSSACTGKKTKREMVELAKRRHPDCEIVDAVKIANNTLKYGKINPGGRASGYTYIALHDTDIISSHKSGGVHISTGGHNTLTTRARLRELAPGSYYTRGGVLHVNGVPFHREAFIAPDGKVTPDSGTTHHKTLRAHIDAYMAEWKRRGLPSREDAKGDPWTTFQSISPEIVLEWVKEKYVFRSLFLFALTKAGMRDAGIHLTLQDIDRKGGELDARDLGRIRRYVRTMLGFG